MRDKSIVEDDRKIFPATRWSAIKSMRSADENERQRALSVIIEAYWKPVYFYVRLKWNKSSEDAKDMTQAFFSKAIEKDYFRKFDPSRARFRTFLRTCLDGFIANENKAEQRLKRGGGFNFQSLEFENAEGELNQLNVQADTTPEDYFEKEWLRHFFGLAVERLRKRLEASDKTVHFQLFKQYDLDDDGTKTTYEALGREFGLTATTVTNYLAAARRTFRQIVMDMLRELTVSEDEYRDEVRSILGIAVAAEK